MQGHISSGFGNLLSKDYYYQAPAAGISRGEKGASSTT
jgi:hypothetical protein